LAVDEHVLRDEISYLVQRVLICLCHTSVNLRSPNAGEDNILRLGSW
jgi:hypothetical protein